MNNKQLECFMQVTLHLSFRRASEALFLTQPAVSHQIQSLEKELGFQLFERRQNRVFLTPAGERFYRDIVPAMGMVRQACENAKRIAAQKERRMLKCAFLRMSPDSMRRLIRDHEESGANYDFSIQVDLRLAPIAVLLSTAADMVFCLKEDLPDSDEYAFIELDRTRDYLVMSCSHRLAQLREIHFSDLRRQNILQMNIKHLSPVFSALIDKITENEPTIQLRFFDDDDFLRASLQAGNGISLQIMSIYDPPQQKDALAAIPFADGGSYMMGVCYLKKNDCAELQHLASLIKKNY